MNISWEEFLKYYTALNIERKAYDEKFEKESGIGEETETPEMEFNPDLIDSGSDSRTNSQIDSAIKNSVTIKPYSFDDNEGLTAPLI